MEALAFSLRNWTSRPADLPILLPEARLFATLAVLGQPGSDTVHFEATSKVTDVSEL